MREIANRRSKKSGLPPGTLIHIGERKLKDTSITVFDYNEESLKEWEINSIDECAVLNDVHSVRWINVDGLHQVDILEKLGSCYGLHPLVMEDILNTEQRPKMEDYGDYIYIVVKMLYFDDVGNQIIMEQQSLVFGKSYVISFGEREGDVFDPVRERLRKGVGRIRKMGADFLAYSLLDIIVDNYFAVLEKLGDSIEQAELILTERPDPSTLGIIHHLKRSMLFIHKAVWPLREVAGTLERGESPLIQDSTRVYLRDVYDHVIQVMDSTEIYRDMLSGMLDIYLSSTSNRMNEIMKVLTVISTVFIPLTFIAGVYGMNFKYMPELNWRWGYFGIIVLMGMIAVLMIAYFKRKRWF